MRDLYTAIGKLSAAAHANGDEIDENIHPTDQNNDRHGLDIFVNGHYLRFRAAPDEPRFTVASPDTLVSRLRQQYTSEELSERSDLEFPALSDEGRERVLQRVISSDLEAAEEDEAAFSESITRELDPGAPDVIRLEHEEQGLWNGVLVRDRIFPYREEFDVTDYRSAVNRLVRVKTTVRTIMNQEIEVLSDDRTGTSLSENGMQSDTNPVGFQ